MARWRWLANYFYRISGDVDRIRCCYAVVRTAWFSASRTIGGRLPIAGSAYRFTFEFIFDWQRREKLTRFARDNYGADRFARADGHRTNRTPAGFAIAHRPTRASIESVRDRRGRTVKIVRGTILTAGGFLAATIDPLGLLLVLLGGWELG